MQLFGTFVVLASALTGLVTASAHDGHHRRHAELAKRASGDLVRRVSGSKWSFYDTETGNMYVLLSLSLLAREETNRCAFTYIGALVARTSRTPTL
jgi:hypothetical protein